MIRKGTHAKKALLASMIMVLLLSALPVMSVLAAPSVGNGGSPTWQNQLRLLRVESALFNNINLRLMPNKFFFAGNLAQQANSNNGYTVTAQQAQGIPVTGGNNTTTTTTSGQPAAAQGTMTFISRGSYIKWVHAQYMLSQYRFAMQQAQTLVANHNGFDANGKVTNDRLANQTMKQMAMYLHMMRKLRENLGLL